jgi:hypothetical protein
LTALSYLELLFNWFAEYHLSFSSTFNCTLDQVQGESLADDSLGLFQAKKCIAQSTKRKEISIKKNATHA